MKMYNKSDLTLINGMLVTPDKEIISVDPDVVLQANSLEDIYQQALYLSAQPAATPMPSLDGFKRESISDGKPGQKFVATTPVMDRQAEEALALMAEIDDVNTVNQANDLLGNFSELLSFADDDYVIDYDGIRSGKFDTPKVGSILELTRERITNIVAFICGLEVMDGNGEDDGIESLIKEKISQQLDQVLNELNELSEN